MAFLNLCPVFLPLIESALAIQLKIIVLSLNEYAFSHASFVAPIAP
jgi:hypothetical protein